jgi:hypothetical protein
MILRRGAGAAAQNILIHHVKQFAAN